MKKSKLHSFYRWSFMIVFPLLFNHCSLSDRSVYNRIQEHADQVSVIDAHEHQHWPEEYGDHT